MHTYFSHLSIGTFSFQWLLQRAPPLGPPSACPHTSFVINSPTRLVIILGLPPILIVFLHIYQSQTGFQQDVERMRRRDWREWRKEELTRCVDGGKERSRGKEEGVNQMDDVANLAFVMTKVGLGDTVINLTM